MHATTRHSDKQDSDGRDRSATRHPRLTLLWAMLLVAGLWGVVLPRIADLPAMQKKIRHLDRQGIDPNAMFYSDHPAAFSDSLTRQP